MEKIAKQLKKLRKIHKQRCRGGLLNRAFAIVALFQNNKYGLTVDQIAKHLNVCNKTVYRYLRTMSLNGFPLFLEIDRPTDAKHSRSEWRWTLLHKENYDPQRAVPPAMQEYNAMQEFAKVKVYE